MSCEVSDKSKNGSSKADHLNTRIPYGIRPVVKVRSYTLIVFQSTHPVWDATREGPSDALALAISIHASRMGCDEPRMVCRSAPSISIHASRMGCDHNPPPMRPMPRNFNPRIPYGMRRFWKPLPPIPAYFNPRIPYGMRLYGFLSSLQFSVISIHASRMGCDATTIQAASCRAYFNPRIPYGMRRHGGAHNVNKQRFQSTHPVWDATRLWASYRPWR